jgi:hypothetical protein
MIRLRPLHLLRQFIHGQFGRRIEVELDTSCFLPSMALTSQVR